MNHRILRSIAIVLLISFSPTVFAAAEVASNGIRSAVSLNGQWEALPIFGFTFTYPPPVDGWKAEKVPGTDSRVLDSPGGPYYPSPSEMFTADRKGFKRHDKIAAWFRRSFDGPIGIPASQRLVLHFDGVAFRSSTWLNGKLLGESLIGHTPHEYDVTDIVKPGQPNLLVVGVAGRESIYDLSLKSYLAPATGVVAGIWGDVSLRIVPRVAIDDLFVKTSVRNKHIDLETTVVNKSLRPRTVLVEGSIADDNGVLQCSIAPVSVTIAPGASSVVTLGKDWLAPRLWSPENPIIYSSSVRVREADRVLDESTQRFGFREFWIQGRDFMLNGVPIVIRRNSTLTMVGGDPIMSEQEMRATAGRPFNTIRLHLGFNNTQLLDSADKFGVMTNPELGFFSIPEQFNLDHPEAWLPTVLAYERDLIKLHRNRPSVVLWNLTNESFWDSVNPNRMKISDALVATAHATDPIRPLEGDGEVTWGGRLPIINIHYPEGTAGVVRIKYPNSGMVVPNDLYWLDNPVDGQVHSWRADFVWDRPLMLGEYFCPSDGPDNASSTQGEEAYDWQKWRLQNYRGTDRHMPNGYIETVRKATDVYRLQGVAGLNPWTGDRQQIMPSIGVRPIEFHPNFYGGQVGSRKVIVFDDSNALVGDWRVLYSLTIGNDTIWEKSVSVRPGPGRPATVSLPIDCPGVTEKTAATLTVRIRNYAGWRQFERYDETIYIMPPTSLAGVDASSIVVLDATGVTTAALAKLGLNATAKTQLEAGDLAKTRLLIIGTGMNAAPYRQVIDKFVLSGGRALLLSPASPTSISSAIPEIDGKHAASQVWLRSHGNAAPGGLDEPQYSYWLPDNLVSVATPYKPSAGNYKILLDAGGLYGLRWSPLLEVSHGNGKFIVSQLNLTDRIGVEPAADAVLVSLVKSSLGDPSPRGSAMRLMVGDNPALTRAIASASIVTSASGGGPTLVDASYLPSADDIDGLKKQLAAGGNVWLHGFTPDTIGKVAALFPFKPELAPIDKTVLSAARRSDDPWMDGLSSFDFSWCRNEVDADGWFSNAQSTASIGKFALVQQNLGVATRLIEPGMLWKIPVGKGAILFDTLPWENAFGSELDKAMRIASTLALNIGGDIVVDPPTSYKYTSISIAKQATRAFYDEVAGDGVGGWTDQGENDMRYFLIDHKGKVGEMAVATGDFPTEATFADRPFTLVDPKRNGGRAVITLRGQGHDPASPVSVKGIVAGCKADKLWFLESACWSVSGNFNELLGRYNVHYDDGTTAEIPLREGIELADWWDMKPLAASRVGWTGRNGMHAPIGMYVTEWTNPHPNKAIATIDLEGNLAQAQIVLVGITAGVESDMAAAQAAPVAAWEFSTAANGSIPSSVAGGAPLRFATVPNVPPAVSDSAGGVRFSHGAQVYGSMKGVPGISDGTPWAVDVDMTVEAKPDGYCGGVIEAGEYLRSGMRIVVGGDLKLCCEIYNADGKGRYLVSSAPLTLGRSYKVRVAFDTGRATLLLNNHIDALIDAPIPSPYGGDFRLGAAGGKDYNFNGVVRSVAITPIAK
ncbi:MAG TPA: glycoside hydrolase family 2 TIM barrel-domain containing protein [Capsulimonadaceae bacterium]|jgi:hypothetical protein